LLFYTIQRLFKNLTELHSNLKTFKDFKDPTNTVINKLILKTYRNLLVGLEAKPIDFFVRDVFNECYAFSRKKQKNDETKEMQRAMVKSTVNSLNPHT
jgi:hypothetical protein